MFKLIIKPPTKTYNSLSTGEGKGKAATKRTHTTKMKKIFLLTSFIVLCITGAIAQQFPVQVTPQLLPPYSLQVSEYYSPSAANAKMNLQVLLRDFNKPQLNVRLRMTIESQSVRIKTREDRTYPTFTILPGQPYYVTPAELTPYFDVNNIEISGMSPQEYAGTGKLPEGFYTFCFELVEEATGQTVSNKGCTFAWMNLNEPPMLNLPRKAERVSPTNPQNVIFNWTPRHTASPGAAFTTEYVMTLVKLDTANNVPPEAAFINGIIIDSIITTGTTILYDAGHPVLEPNSKYAWRVQARTATGSAEPANFRNNGFSEIFWFVYQNTCPQVLGVTDSTQGRRAIIEWQTNPQHLEYKVIYREKGNATAEWFSQINTGTQVSIGDLKPLTTYEYRVGGACDYGFFVFGPTMEFTTKGENVTAVPNCGVPPALPVLNPSPMLIMHPGDTVYAGDFKVVTTLVDNINGDNGVPGTFTGEGYVPVSYLANMKLAVVFRGIKVNAEKKLIDGQIETTYDPTEGGIADVDALLDYFIPGYGLGKLVTGEVMVDASFNFIIGSISALPLPVGYDTLIGKGPVPITITPLGGGTPTIYNAEKLPITIKDKDGNLYQVDKNGTIKSLGRQGGKELLRNMNPTQIDDDKALAKFIEYNDTKVKYAFDEWKSIYKNSTKFNKEYERIKTVKNKDYYVSAKAIAPAAVDYLKVKITKTDNSIKADSIKFINSKGTIYNAVLLDSTGTGEYNYEITVVGGPEKDAQEIYAIYRQTSAKTLNLGKVFVASYPRQERKLKLIPVNGVSPDYNEIKDNINKIYNPLNIYFNYITDDNWNNSTWDQIQNNALDVEANSFLSSYSLEMKKIRDAYLRDRKPLPDEFCLFLLNKANPDTIAGDMPIGKRFGYIFLNKYPDKKNVFSHEIGHGLFNLKHTFDGYSFEKNQLPDNVMDYSNGSKFSKHQWDLLHDPALSFGLFNNDEDNQLNVVANAPLSADLLTDNKYFCFITPSGHRIVLDQSIKFPVFAVGLPDLTKLKTLTGALLEFKDKDGIEYKADYSDTEFRGYKKTGTNTYLSVGTVMKNVDELMEKNDFVLYLPETKEQNTIYKFRAPGVANYSGGTTTEKFDEFNFVKLFDGVTQVIKTQSRTSGIYGDNYDQITKLSLDFIASYKKTPGVLFAHKITQIGNLYKQLLTEFSRFYYWPNWDKISECALSDRFHGVWDKKVYNSSLLKGYISDKKYYEFYSEMLTDFIAFVTSKTTGPQVPYYFKSTPELTALNITERVKLLKELFQNCVKDEDKFLSIIPCGNVDPGSFAVTGEYRYYLPDNEANIVRLFQSTPANQEKALLDSLLTPVRFGSTETLLYKITKDVCGLDEEDFDNFVGWLNSAVLRNSSNFLNTDELKRDVDENRIMYFDPGFWGNTFDPSSSCSHYSKDYYENGTIKVVYKKDCAFTNLMGAYEIAWDKVSPYQLIPVFSAVDIKDVNGRVLIKKKTLSSLPAYTIMAWIIAENKSRIRAGISGAIDLALLAVGVGEVQLAIRGGLTLKNAARVTKGIVDLGVGFIDILLKDERIIDEIGATPAGQRFLTAYNKFQLFYGFASLSYEAVGFIKNMRNEAVAVKNSLNNPSDKTLIDNIISKAESSLNTNTKPILQRLDDLAAQNINLTNVRSLQQSVIDKLDNLSNDYLKLLDADLAHPTHGTRIRELLEENPADIDIWRNLKDDPAYHWELFNTTNKNDPRWLKWSQREFFVSVTGKGKTFEEITCLNSFKNRSLDAGGNLINASDDYKKLKKTISDEFKDINGNNINLDEYDMFSQVQLSFDPVLLDNGKTVDFFIADQVFVKFKTNAVGLKEVEDVIVIENKLKYSTSLTENQKEALKQSKYKVRNQQVKNSEYDPINGNKLNNGNELNFKDGKIKWVKVYDSENGDVITDMKKL
jgi:hypothetical protein